MGRTQKRREVNAVFEEQRRYVAGIDLAGHADHFVCGPRREDGSPNIRHFGTTTGELEKMLAWLRQEKVVSVAMESKSVYWIPVCDLLESASIEVVLVDTREVRMVPGRKSDVQDCQWLQKLHSCGVTGLAILHAIVNGERDPLKLATMRDRRCKKSEAEIAEHLRGNWRSEHLFNLGQALRTYEFIAERICDYERQILALVEAEKRQASVKTPDHPDDKKAGVMRRLGEEQMRDALFQMSGTDLTVINGIRPETAAVIVSEIGLDFTRFHTEKHFVSYIGLAPRLGKSAGKNVRQKRRFKNTSRVGAALRMSASTQRYAQSELGAYFRNVARRQDAKTAIKSTARRMAILIYRLVRFGKAFIDRGSELYETQFRAKKVRNLGKLVKSLGLNELELKIVFGET